LRRSLGALFALLALGCGIRHQLTPNKPDAEGYTPLMRAAARNDVAEIRSLRRRGADPNYQGRQVKTYGILFPFVSVEWKDVPKDSLTPLGELLSQIKSRGLHGVAVDLERGVI
ncbi:MAG TPA: hypothetical protein VFM29_04660, partial [Vicinamibacteria bacterium]|nr:hypothetical protein [Vicinamibacteria bacterium]